MTTLHLSTAELTQDERASWRRGVLASYGNVTAQRADDFTTKNKITLRDGVLILLGAMGMYGTQLATQYGMRSDIRDFGTKLENVQQQEASAISTLQTQINEWRTETKLNRERDSDRMREIAELKGLLTGIGILKEPRK